MELQRKKRKLSPPQVLIAGFAAIILLGGILLSTPWVTKSGESIGFLNGLFTSTTSVCVTGLVVVDTCLLYTSSSAEQSRWSGDSAQSPVAGRESGS